MGLIELERDGRPLYRYRYNFRRDPDTGKKLFDTKESRDRSVIDQFIAERTPITTAQSDKITVHQLLHLWQRAHHPDHATGRTKPWELRTRKDRDQQAKLRISPFLGRDRVAALTPQRVEAWLDWMLEPVKQDDGTRKARFGTRVANKALQDLKAAIRWGRGKGIVENVYIDDVRGIPAPPPKPPRPYTPKEVAQIMEGCAHMRDATMVAVAAYSGLRWSELRGLKWGDVSSDLRTIHVQRSIDMDRREKLPKNGTTRTTVLLRRGREALAAYRDALPERSAGALVFPNRNGHTLTAEWHRERLPKIRAACGLHFDMHELRDTYASLLIASRKVKPEELMLWLGHASLETTLKRYARLYESHRHSVADSVDELIDSLG